MEATTNRPQIKTTNRNICLGMFAFRVVALNVVEIGGLYRTSVWRQDLSFKLDLNQHSTMKQSFFVLGELSGGPKNCSHPKLCLDTWCCPTAALSQSCIRRPGNSFLHGKIFLIYAKLILSLSALGDLVRWRQPRWWARLESLLRNC